MMQNSKKNLLDAKQDKDKTTRRWFVRRQFAGCFPPGEFPSYAAFFQAPGQTIKHERRTRVAILPPRVDRRHAGATKALVLKTYAYPFFPRIRTGFRISKAEREFNGLVHLSNLGIPAVEPVAFGSERTRLGLVRSCFLVTVFADGTTNLAAPITRTDNKNHATSRAALIEQIAMQLRRAHERRFFLFTPKAKNILVRQNAGKPADTIFLDIPYARSLRWLPLARWAQGRDLGVFLASLIPYATEEELGVFYQAYLPNPLGGSADKLRRRGRKSMLAKQNRTFVTSLTNSLKRRLRHLIPDASRFGGNITRHG